jgi:hypothetical protein
MHKPGSVERWEEEKDQSENPSINGQLYQQPMARPIVIAQLRS